MPLPHPHGAASGEIGHNASYDTGDVPGSTGGKFIGFGEQGTSAIGNRAHWALSENIDYVYDAVAGEKAFPTGASHTTADQGSGGQQTYQIIDEVFVGDATYPGSNGSYDADYREGMLMLFAVLDDQYNELVDGSGNEVRVQDVKDAGDVTDQYKLANPTWAVNPTLHFRTVNPVTGAPVTDDYIIPTGTAIRILYGYKGTMESMPIDIFTRFKVQSATEVEAGAVLQDGTRAMTGDLDFGANKAKGVTEVQGAAASDLVVESQQEFSLQDQHLTLPVNLSQSGINEISSAGIYNSIIGGINSGLLVSQWFGNSVVAKSNPVTFVGGSGLVTIGVGTIIILNGEGVDVGGQSFTATSGQASRGVINSSGEFVEAAGAASGAGDDEVVICQHNWNGAAFTESLDLTFARDKRGGVLPITVGAEIGCDFADLQTAVDAVSILSGTAPAQTTKILICGELSLSTTVTLPANADYSFEGLSGSPPSAGSREGIYWAGAASDTNVIDCSSSSVRFQNLKIEWHHASAEQGTTKAFFVNPGPGSSFKNLRLAHTTYRFHLIRWNANLVTNMNMDIRNVYSVSASSATGGSGSIIDIDSVVTYAKVRDCYIPDTEIHLGGAFNTIDNCDAVCTTIGHAGKATGNRLTPDNFSLPVGVGAINLSAAAEGSDGFSSFFVDHNYIFNCERAVVHKPTAGMGTVTPSGIITNNLIVNTNGGVVIDNTSTTLVGTYAKWVINNNQFIDAWSGAAAWFIYLEKAGYVTVSNCHFVEYTDNAIESMEYNKLSVINNIFEPVNGTGLRLHDGDHGPAYEHVIIRGNILYGNNSSGTVWLEANDTLITGNIFSDLFGGGSHQPLWVTSGYPANNLTVENNIIHRPSGGAVISLLDATSKNVIIRNNTIFGTSANNGHINAVCKVSVQNNAFIGLREGLLMGAAVRLKDAGVSGSVIEGNYMYGMSTHTVSPMAVVFIEWSSTKPVECVVSNNVFDRCGQNSAYSAGTGRGIHAEGDNHSICGNRFLYQDGFWLAGAAGKITCIETAGAGMVVSHNTFVDNYSLAQTAEYRRCSGDWNGIYHSGGDIFANGNVFSFSGTVTEPDGKDYLIHVLNANANLSNNMVTGGERNPGNLNYLINVTNGRVIANNNFLNGLEFLLITSNTNYSTFMGNLVANGSRLHVTGTGIAVIGNVNYNALGSSGGVYCYGSGGIVMGNVGGTSTGSHTAVYNF